MLQRVNLSASILGATQHQQTYSGQVTAVDNWAAGTAGQPACGWPYQRTLVDIPVSYDAKKNGKATPAITRNFGATVQHLVFLHSNATYAYVVGDLYHNNSLGLYLRQSYGGGFGVTRGRAEFDADLRFVGEHFYSAGVSASPAAIRYSEPCRIIQNYSGSCSK